MEDTKKPARKKPGLVQAGMGSGIWRAIVEGKPYPIRGIIWDTNPLALSPRGNQVRESLRKMDLIVYLGRYPNLTYQHAHVVFPIPSFLETEGVVFASIGRNIQWANRVVEPRGECRPAEEFWGGLLKRFGFAPSHPFIDSQGKVNIRELTEFFLTANPLTAGITPELLDPETNPPGGIQWPAASKADTDFPSNRAAVRGYEGLFRPGSRFPGNEKRFPTPSGKVNISRKEIAEEKGFERFAPHSDLPGIPPRERNSLRGNRFILITGELVDYVPSAGLWTLPQKPEKSLFVQIHPQRAKTLGIQNGEMVVIENERGKIKAPVWVTDQVDEETIFCPLGADPYDSLYPYESPCSLMDFVPENENCGRRFLEATLVKVHKSS